MKKILRQQKLRQIAVVVGLVLLCTPALASSNESDDLRKTYEEILSAINQRDINKLDSFWHELVTISGTPLPSVLQGKEAWLSFLHTTLQQVEEVGFRPLDTQFDVVDNTATLKAQYVYEFRSRDYPRTIRVLGNLSFTFVKTNGRWLIISGIFYEL